MFNVLENDNISVEGTFNILFPMLKKIYDASVNQITQINNNIRMHLKESRQIKGFLKHFDGKMVKQYNFVNKAIINIQDSIIALEKNMIDIFVNFSNIRNSHALYRTLLRVLEKN
jgi:hypothetical protein